MWFIVPRLDLTLSHGWKSVLIVRSGLLLSTAAESVSASATFTAATKAFSPPSPTVLIFHDPMHRHGKRQGRNQDLGARMRR